MMPGGCDDRMTFVSIPFSSMICWTMCPGGTCIGIGSGGPLLDTMRTVAGPASTHTSSHIIIVVNSYKKYFRLSPI